MGWRAARGAARTGPLSARPAFDQQCAASRRAAPRRGTAAGHPSGSPRQTEASEVPTPGTAPEPPRTRCPQCSPAAPAHPIVRHFAVTPTRPPPPPSRWLGQRGPDPLSHHLPLPPSTAGCPSAPGAQCRPVGRWAGAGPGARSCSHSRSRSPSRNAISIKNPLLGTFRQRCFIGIHTAPPACPGARVTGGDPAAQRAGGRTAAREVTLSAAAEPQPGDGGFAGAGSGTPQLPPSTGGMEQPGCPLCRGEAGRRRGALQHAA